MALKDVLSLVLQTSPLWTIPVSIAISILAAMEGARGKKPVKTAMSLMAFLLLMAILVFCWCIF